MLMHDDGFLRPLGLLSYANEFEESTYEGTN